jgi:hypothetical protein
MKYVFAVIGTVWPVGAAVVAGTAGWPAVGFYLLGGTLALIGRVARFHEERAR